MTKKGIKANQCPTCGLNKNDHTHPVPWPIPGAKYLKGGSSRG